MTRPNRLHTKRGMARWVFPRGGKSEKGPVVRKINLIKKKNSEIFIFHENLLFTL